MENDREQKSDEIYKKFYKAANSGGFLSLKPWWDAGKISVDIGDLDGQSLKSHTQAWCNLINLGMYLKAVYEGNAKSLYPISEKNGIPSEEGFAYYGGSNTEDGPVSRIVKIHHWQIKDEFDPRSFVWKTGTFEARVSSTGAFIPDMSKCKSSNAIKVSRLEMAEIHYRLDLAISSFTTRDEDWISKFNGKRKVS